MKKTKKPKSVEFEFNFYLKVIKETMKSDGSFLELGPGQFSISDHFQNVTIIDNDIRVLKRHVKKKRNVLCADYYSLVLKPNSFDYVVALHPNIYNSGKNIEWVDFKEKEFRFKEGGLEGFVSSLLNIAKKRVFIGSKKIVDDLPMERFVDKVCIYPPPFVLYEKSEHFTPYNLKEKSFEVKKWKI